ncbi:hypothetical protein D3C85_1260940 [compost metagenome]
MTGVIFQDIVNRVAGGVAINHDTFTRCSAQKLIKRHSGGFGFDIPQRHIDGRNGRHRDRSAPPVRAFIEELPDVFDAMRIAANQLRTEMIFKVRGNGQLASV